MLAGRHLCCLFVQIWWQRRREGRQCATGATWMVDVGGFSDQSKAEQNGSGASGTAEHQEQGLAPAAPDDVLALQQVPPKQAKARAGCKRRAWTEHEMVQKTENLRTTALSWLKGHNTVHSVLTSSTWFGKRKYLAKCTERDGGPGDSPAGEASSMAIPNLQTTESGADPDACSRLPFLFTFFLQNPPENIRVDADSLICEVDQVRILLSLPEAADWFQTCDLPWFLMDFTMKTNAPGLVLACAGRHWTCRFEAAHGLLMQKDVAMAESAGMELTDGIFDCACYAAAKATVSEQGMLPSRLRLAALGLGVYCDLGTILLRLAIDWDETVFEQYIRANLLHVEGNVIRAFWQTGFGAAWVARAGGSHAAFAFASDPVCHVLDEPWRGAKTTWATRSVEQDGDDSEVELEQRSKRLSLDDMLKHFRKHAAGGTFLASVTSRVLSDGRQALLLYVLPTYRLELGTHRREDIAAALKLGLTTTVQQVHGACADPETGHYDFVRHMFLRRTYSTVYVRQVWLRMWKLVHAWMPAMLVLMPGSPIKFDAINYGAELPMTAADLRAEVVSYLRQFGLFYPVAQGRVFAGPPAAKGTEFIVTLSLADRGATMDFQQSAEELLTKLDTYREQLAQVEEALEQQPDEPSLVKLKNDLTEVIVLTEDLVKYQAAAPTEAETGAETAGRASAPPVPLPTSRSAGKSVHTALVGRTCEAFFEQKWYNGEIKSVRRDERGQERCMVEFIGFSNSREFKVTDVRLLRPPHPAQCQPGTKCQ
ncbi:smndc1, partial [Symbiodinium microadriaticum]